jgi:hypothetical protein
MARAALCALLAAVLPSCGDDGAPGDDPAQCLESLPMDCAATLSPTFDTIYDKVFSASCGAVGQGTSCHGSEGLKGGLGLFSADVAYEDLLGMNGRARVVLGDAKCSILMQRLESNDAKFRMPLGDKMLPPGVRCAIQRWIDDGAARR